MKFKLDNKLATQLRASVERFGGIGVWRLEYDDGTPCCIFGHATVIDGKKFGETWDRLNNCGYSSLLGLDAVLTTADPTLTAETRLSFDRWIELTKTELMAPSY